MKRLHWPLIFMTLTFIAPMIAAGIMLKFADPKNISTVQHGAFIEPQYLQLQNVSYIVGEHYANKWNVVYLQPETCEASCEDRIQVLQNLHAALGAQRDRVAIISASIAANDIEHEPEDLLILNPNKLYIMRYNGIVKYSGLLKDLRRLLKYSHA